MPTQEERSEATRAKLLATARRLFETRGYAETAIEDVTREAGLTKGAFYHHFDDKKAIFRAVFEEAERQLARAASDGARGKDAWRRFRAGCRAFLEASLEPGLQRIALREAPGVLGWETFREIDARHTLGLIEGGLALAMRDGHVRLRSPETLARLLFGTLCEGARMIAASPEPRKMLRRVLREVDALLAGVAAPSQPAAPGRRRSVRPRRPS
jgi:AcrR family transcriptional regulator